MGEFWAPGAEIWLFKKKNMDRSIDLAVWHREWVVVHWQKFAVADLGFDPGLCACTITPSSVLCSLSCLFSALMQSLRCTPATIKYSWLYFLQFRNLYVFSIKHCTPAAFLSSRFSQLNEGSLRMIFQFIMAGANILDIRVATRLGLAASPVRSAADAQSVWVPEAWEVHIVQCRSVQLHPPRLALVLLHTPPTFSRPPTPLTQGLLLWTLFHSKTQLIFIMWRSRFLGII